MRQVSIITDLQFGSTGKGLLAGYLAHTLAPDTVVTAWGPNAGHTFIDAGGRKFVNIMLPNGIVSPKLKRIMIGPGAVIEPERFLWELEEYRLLLRDVDVMIHPHAAVVHESHRIAEKGYGFAIGSTMKGVGEAMIQKIRRRVGHENVANTALIGTNLQHYVAPIGEWNSALDASRVVLVEGAQGFSLSINHGFYPFTTSRDCTVAQLMVDCAIPMGWVDDADIYGVCRTFPIRVANRYDEAGNMIGTSGPCYDDQAEISWLDIGREPELTTVTKLPRRIFTFSEQQVREACRMNDVDFIFLNFCNYLTQGNAENLAQTIDQYAPVTHMGWGPTFTDVKER